MSSMSSLFQSEEIVFWKHDTNKKKLEEKKKLEHKCDTLIRVFICVGSRIMFLSLSSFGHNGIKVRPENPLRIKV